MSRLYIKDVIETKNDTFTFNLRGSYGAEGHIFVPDQEVSVCFNKSMFLEVINSNSSVTVEADQGLFSVNIEGDVPDKCEITFYFSNCELQPWFRFSYTENGDCLWSTNPCDLYGIKRKRIRGKMMMNKFLKFPIEKKFGISLQGMGLVVLVISSAIKLPIVLPIFGMGCVVVGTYCLIRQIYIERTLI